MNFEASDSLAVKYRPRILDDIVGNSHNIDLIRGYISKRKMPRSWLLIGNPGSGKTTSGRILSMIINCENLTDGNPCLTCDSCKLALRGHHPDIHEINFAGEQGKVDSFREILSVSKLRPRYSGRVILADEIQGATPGTKKEILKTLEEPPPSTYFILCTMNPEKLDKAILGRCTKLQFSYPTELEMAKRLLKISKLEFPELVSHLKPYLKRIAYNSGCQPRESVEALSQIAVVLSGKKTITDELVKATVDTVSVNTGDLEDQSVRFLTYLLLGKKLDPLTTIRELDSNRLEEFMNTVFRYSYFSAVWLMSRKAKTKMNYKGFWGLNFNRIVSNLEKLQSKVSEDDCFRLCSAITAATEKIRMGLVSPEQAALMVFSNYFKE